MNAEPSVMIGGRLVPASRAHISPLSEGFQFGYGVFETMRSRRGRPVFFEDHAARLARAAAGVGLAPEAAAGGEGRCRRLLAGVGRPVALKWILYRDEAGATGEALLVRDDPYKEEHYARGFVLRTMPGAGGGGVKTLARLPQLLARRAAQAAGADEALWIGPEDEVLEGAGTNVFAVEGGVVLTPPLDGRILPGIARARAVRLGSAHEARLTRKRLLAADEVFVTNALVGVMPVARVDERGFGLDRNPVTRELRRLYEAEAAGSLAAADYGDEYTSTSAIP